MVRIISGVSKGIRLKVPGFTNKVRPTSDRVKEALFSILADKVLGAKVLDLFCGIGNLGLEAISRGAKECCFIEKNNVCIQALKQNIEKLKVDGKTKIIKGDVFKSVPRLSFNSTGFDLVFADPPYDFVESIFQKPTNLLKKLHEYSIFSDSATFVLEHKSVFNLPEQILDGYFVKQKKYGSTTLTIIEVSNGNQG